MFKILLSVKVELWLREFARISFRAILCFRRAEEFGFSFLEKLNGDFFPTRGIL
jgi:hypothetical protein